MIKAGGYFIVACYSLSYKMIITIILSLVLWFVVPLLIDGRVKRKSDRKAYKILCRIIAIAILAVDVFGSFM